MNHMTSKWAVIKCVNKNEGGGGLYKYEYECLDNIMSYNICLHCRRKIVKYGKSFTQICMI